MKKWENTLTLIFNRLAFEQDKIDRNINGIHELIHRSKILEPYDSSLSSYILLPHFSSAYVIAFFLILPQEGMLYDCAEDLKTGAGDCFDTYQLNQEEIEWIKNSKWPVLFKTGKADAKRSRPFQHVIND